MNTEDISRIHILFVDDDQMVLNAIRRTFHAQQNFHIYITQTVSEAWEVLKIAPVDILVTDYLMPDVTGIEFAKLIQQQFPQVLIFILTGHSKLISFQDEHPKINIAGIISKPWNNAELIQKFTNIYLFRKQKFL